MATLGIFTKDGNRYAGTLQTLTIKADITIEPVERKSNDNQPDYRVLHVTGEFTSDIGAAWAKTSREGASYLSVTIDDPSFDSRLNCRLVKTGAEHSHTLFWERPRPYDGK